MPETSLDFDQCINRKGTSSLKYDFSTEHGKSGDVIPMWVADMDFKTSSYVTDALINTLKEGVYGYSESGEAYFNAVKSWMKRRHNWDVEKEWLVKTPGIVFAIALAVKAYTNPGDGVLIQRPVYYPFTNVILSNDRKVVNNPLVEENGYYHIDFVDFEKRIIDEKVKLFLLCSPHNPVGRVWKKEELKRLGEICKKHGVTVVSDEIHSDFVFEGEHTVFANAEEGLDDISIICTSPSKTFNLAGLQVSNIFIKNEELRKKFVRQLDAVGYDQVSLPGLIACEAAYKDGDSWIDAAVSYIKSNIDYVRDYTEKNLPKIKVVKQEGLYLVWLDFREYGLSDKELNTILDSEAKLWLDAGTIFGPEGSGFQRINVACPRATLEKALANLKEAFSKR